MEYEFIERDITTPKHGLVVYTDSYWYCVDGDPTKALFYSDGYNHAPQCNKNKNVMVSNLGFLYQKYKKDVTVVFVPIAYVPKRD